MATFRKRGSKWRAEIFKNGVRTSRSFFTKAEATTWALESERDIHNNARNITANKTLGDLLKRYRDEVTPSKKGARWERVRIDKILKDELAAVALPELNASHFAAWRDRSLKKMSAASVRREWNIINPAINVAMREWRWITKNPMSDVRRPKPPKARDRRITDNEIERLLNALGYDADAIPNTITARVGAAFLFAIETAMRASEITGLTWARIDLEYRTAKLVDTKNGHARSVALSSEAINILKRLKRVELLNDSVFGLTPSSVDALFRKAKARALIEDLHFHDSRHEAITRLAQKIEVLDLARMVGIRDLRILMVYYNQTAAEIAKKLG